MPMVLHLQVPSFAVVDYTGAYRRRNPILTTTRMLPQKCGYDFSRAGLHSCCELVLKALKMCDVPDSFTTCDTVLWNM
jgi:hypothetical protein